MDRLRDGGTRAFTTGLAEAEHVRADHGEERRELTTLPQPTTIPDARAVADTVVSPETTALNGTAEESTVSHQPASTHTRTASIPNARKGFRLTLWVSPTDETGLADAHGFLQLDGADPVPFCQLKAVPNPLARALQAAYVAIEQVRARPPRMPPPTAPQVRSTTAAQPRKVAAPPAGQPAAHAVQTTATKTKAAPAQPSLF